MLQACRVAGRSAQRAVRAPRQLYALVRGRPQPGAVLTDVRSVVHLPAAAWAATKLTGALGTAFSAVKHYQLSAALAVLVQQVGVRALLKSLREVNESLAGVGAYQASAHESISASIDRLEHTLENAANSERIQIFEDWLQEVNKQAPQLVALFSKFYLEKSVPWKVAVAVAKDLKKESPQAPTTVDGVPADEWERRIHAAFPELTGTRILIIPKEGEERAPRRAAGAPGGARREATEA
mmetsp:Transcript_79950/g.183212  ORF Transcript_79950/g.183212 Transcript_79950/m.183212 type:complete len:239 (+) Transcript_79950:35-751(+)